MTEIKPLAVAEACPAVNQARDLLAAVLVGAPAFDARLTVSEAVDVLSDTWPLLPPLAYPETGIDVVPGVTAAVAALALSAEQAPTAEEAVRAGLAARLLRDLLQQMAADDVLPTSSGR